MPSHVATPPRDRAGSARPGAGSLRVWLNGELYADPTEARLAVTDHGLVVGDGVFEALKVTPAGPFAVSRHLRRLQRSARALGLPAPDVNVVRAAIAAVTEDAGWAFGKVRVTYTGGPGPLGSHHAFGPPRWWSPRRRRRRRTRWAGSSPHRGPGTSTAPWPG